MRVEASSDDEFSLRKIKGISSFYFASIYADHFLIIAFACFHPLLVEVHSVLWLFRLVTYFVSPVDWIISGEDVEAKRADASRAFPFGHDGQFEEFYRAF